MSELKAETFFGKIVLQRNGTTIERDSRPSDAIALAVRTGAPIYAEDAVLDRAGVEFDPESGRGHFYEDSQWDLRSFSEIKESDYAFSEEAKRLFGEAGKRVFRLGHEEVTPEHILSALLEEVEGAGAKVLVELGLDLDGARARLEEHVERGNRESVRELLDFSEASQRVLHLARTEAYMIFHGQAGSEHILLGLVLADEGLASKILKESGIKIEAARAAVRKMIDSAE